jgi:hypothetical protein
MRACAACSGFLPGAEQPSSIAATRARAGRDATFTLRAFYGSVAGYSSAGKQNTSLTFTSG